MHATSSEVSRFLDKTGEGNDRVFILALDGPRRNLIAEHQEVCRTPARQVQGLRITDSDVRRTKHSETSEAAELSA